MRLVKTSHRDIFRIQRGTRFAAYFHIGTSTSQFLEKFSTRMSCRIPFCWELVVILSSLTWRKKTYENHVSLNPNLNSKTQVGKCVSIKNSIKPYQRTLFSWNRAIRYYKIFRFFRVSGGLLEISWIVTPLPSFTSVSQLLNNLTGSNE